MRGLPILLTFFLLVTLVQAAFSQSNPSTYDAVDTFIGTGADGNTFPGATVPFGMIQWSPDTRPDGWYHFGDKTIRGLSLTHISGAGCPVYGDLPILPWTKQIGESDDPSQFTSAYSHDKEQTHPGYYSVQFEDGSKAELSVAERAGIGRFEFPAGGARAMVFNAAGSATINAPHREKDESTIEIRGKDAVSGTVHSGGFCGSPTHYALYFVARFDKPFASSGTWTDKVSPGSTSASGHMAGAYVSFPDGAEPVLMKIGISFVSVANAEENLVKEIPGWDFDTVRTSAKAAWTKALDLIQADGGTPEQRTIFYTGVYHSMLSPNVFSDENGDYTGFDQRVRRLPPGKKQFANFSDWDIYRNTIQFQALLFPEQTNQMMQSLVRDAEQSGWLPRWAIANDNSYIMGGDSSAILLSEAYAFGARDFDLKSALHFMIKGATDPGKGLHNYAERPGLADYMAKGYVPVSEYEESGASYTMEYANADFAVSRFAAAVGDEANAAILLRRAQNWRKLFDKEIGWIRPRTADGKFIEGFDSDHLLPHRVKQDPPDQMGFEEGSTWQYTFMLPFNYTGLFREMGGAHKAEAKLDKFFVKLSGWGLPNFTVTNEPDFCAPYAYLWTGSPWKTQQVIDRIRRETFTTKPDGLPGNDDLGATSGVYVWNAMGIYPEIPGVGGFTIGTPMFSRVRMEFGNGKTLEVSSKGEGSYVRGVRVNGASHSSSWLKLSDLAAPTNTIDFEMQSEPDHVWATKESEFPPSFDGGNLKTTTKPSPQRARSYTEERHRGRKF
jgi:predicted alpha-1,2-mannosidase